MFISRGQSYKSTKCATSICVNCCNDLPKQGFVTPIFFVILSREFWGLNVDRSFELVIGKTILPEQVDVCPT